jgi:hypothetical protein
MPSAPSRLPLGAAEPVLGLGATDRASRVPTALGERQHRALGSRPAAVIPGMWWGCCSRAARPAATVFDRLVVAMWLPLFAAPLDLCSKLLI